ncbi:hypothetical protein CPC197_2221, partial [Chlamydia psittaci C1/97]
MHTHTTLKHTRTYNTQTHMHKHTHNTQTHMHIHTHSDTHT